VAIHLTFQRDRCVRFPPPGWAVRSARGSTRHTNKPGGFRLCLYNPAQWAGNPATGRAYSLKTTGRWSEIPRRRGTPGGVAADQFTS
jgi:hypothetical protein